jgi:hypothetical protein
MMGLGSDNRGHVQRPGAKVSRELTFVLNYAGIPDRCPFIQLLLRADVA